MAEPDDIPRDYADRLFRDALKQPANLRDFLNDAIPDIAGGLDFERMELLDREFPLDDWRRRESDLLFRIPWRDGAVELETLICVLIEHQGRPDPRMPLRLLLYAVLYWEREWKAWESLPTPRPEFRLAPLLPIVFHTGLKPWATHRSLGELFCGPDLFKAFAPTWPVCFWDLAEHSPQALIASTQQWLRTLAVVRSADADSASFLSVLQAVMRDLSQLGDDDHVRWHDLLNFVLTLSMKLRSDEEHDKVFHVVSDSQRDAHKHREVQEMGMTIEESLIEKGRVQGIEKGTLNTRRIDLLEMLEEKFGELPHELVRRVESTNDAKALQQVLRQVIRVQNLDELDW